MNLSFFRNLLSKVSHVSGKKVVIIIIIIALLITNALTLKLYLDTYKVDEAKQIDETGDELSRAKFFIKDWYDELSAEYGNGKVYLNEIRFNGDAYSLTFGFNRIRAVYPRGERFFPLNYITNVEFFTVNEHLQCRLYYNETGELTFKLD